MVDVSQTVLDSCKEWLKKTSASWTGGVTKGKSVHLDGSETGMYTPHTACHAWMTYNFARMCYGNKDSYYLNDWSAPYKDDAKTFLTLSCHSKVRSKTVCSPEACDFLVKWMATESPFAWAILNRDDEESLTEGGVIILCGPGGLNASQAMWVCKVLRFITEGAKAADTFMTLVKGGVDPMLSVYVASGIRAIKGAVFSYTGFEGHSTVCLGANVFGMVERNINPKATCTANVFKPSEKFAKKSVGPDHLKNFCKPFKKSDGWGGTVSGEGATAEELINHVLQWQNEMGIVVPSVTVLPPVDAKPAPMPTASTVYLDLDL